MKTNLSNFDITSKITNFRYNIIHSRKYWFIYLVLLVIASLSMMNVENYIHPKMEILMIIFLSIVGIVFISYFYHHDEKELYKIVFIFLIVFGLLTSVIVPIDTVSDEGEHLVRAEMTSRGILFPNYVNGSYETINSITDFFVHSIDKTVFEVDGDNNHINYQVSHIESAFEQNPFYGYLFSGLGILIAKLLDLNVIWMLWLARIFNSLCYSILVSYAIKKTPILKMPLFFISCLPVCLFQAFSVSIDSILAGLGILTISLFIFMFKNKFGIKELLIFSCLCLLTGLCKLPYLALILLLFCLPKDNFKNNNYFTISFVSLIVVGLVGILWSRYYANPALLHSWRAIHFVENNVNVVNQIGYLLSHPFDLFTVFFNIFNSFPNIFNGLFSFYAYTIEGGVYNASQFISVIVLVSFILICFAYPIKEKIDLKYRFPVLIVFLVIYFGTYFVQLLSWNPVGSLNITGVHTRYFLPLFALLPFIFHLNNNLENSKEWDAYVFILILVFVSLMLISFIIKYY